MALILEPLVLKMAKALLDLVEAENGLGTNR
jgi:hypothetical protein